MRALRWIIGREACHDLMVARIRKLLKKSTKENLIVVYDAFDLDAQGLPIDNLDDVAMNGQVRVIDECWDAYRGEILYSPTWGDLAIEANRIIVASGDHHHIFFEGLEPQRHQPEDGVVHLSLGLGS